MKSLTTLKVALLFLLHLSPLFLCGCVRTARAPGNHSLWHSSLPERPDFRDVSFILRNAPKADFAFLLTQKYPQSYIVWTQSQDDLMRKKQSQEKLYLPEESKFAAGWLDKEADKTLGPVLIFHEGKAIALPSVPDEFNIAAVQLNWAQTKTDPGFYSLLTIHYPISIPFSEITGLGPPLPYWYSSDKTQILTAEFSNHHKQFVAPRREEMKLLSGIWWFPLFGLYYDDTYKEGSLSDDFSPGGWAFCLEKLLRDKDIRELARHAGSDLSTRKTAAFNDIFKREGYILEPSPEELSFSASAGHDVSILSLGGKRTNICVLRSLQSGKAYFWQDGYAGQNWLTSIETKLDPPSKVVISTAKSYSSLQSIRLEWEAMDYAGYEIQWFDDSQLNHMVGSKSIPSWHGSYHGTQSQDIDRLTNGQQYWIRMRAIRGNEIGPWSDVVTPVLMDRSDD